MIGTITVAVFTKDTPEDRRRFERTLKAVGAIMCQLIETPAVVNVEIQAKRKRRRR